MDSEVKVIEACQQEAFPEEYKALVYKRALPHNSNLLVLNPRLDEDGLMRSNSRLANVENLSFDAGYPIILPRYVTRLIVKHAHEKGSHVSGTNGTLAELSKRFWIVSAPEAIREWEQSCMNCKRRSAKVANAVLGNGEVTDEKLTSAFIATEALLNSRPLTYQSANSMDIVPLTPSHFLHGELSRETAPTIIEANRHPKHRWRRVQEVVRHFWHRWLKEWLPSLATRKKWNSPTRDFAVGDVVLVMNGETVRGHWPLGRIVAVYPGSDGHVRVAEVQVDNTVLKRPVAVLSPLEFQD